MQFLCAVPPLRYILLVSNISPTSVLHLLYYLPLLFITSSITMLFLTWFRLNSTAAAKRGIWAANLVVVGMALVLHQLDMRLTPLPVVLGAVAAAVLFLHNTRQSLRLHYKYLGAHTHCRKFSKVTVLRGVCAALFAFLLVEAPLLWYGMYGAGRSSPWALVVRHLLWRATEGVHVCLQLFALHSLSDSANAVPFPNSPKFITAKWLTTVLKKAESIPCTVKVLQLFGEKLQGGYHSKVRKFEIRYQKPVPPSAPRFIVVKMLAWDTTYLERLLLFLRKTVGGRGRLMNQETMHLTSYEIEANMYRHMSHLIKGVKVPYCYYIHEDCFNNKFGLVLKDVADCRRGRHTCEGGQPDGFGRGDSGLLLARLAAFHAAFWRQGPQLERQFGVWGTGGYWTGPKRLPDKLPVRRAWDAALAAFGKGLRALAGQEGGEPSLPPSLLQLGERLERSLLPLEEEFFSLAPTTLLHGDYKISNVFIKKRIPQEGEAPPVSPSSFIPSFSLSPFLSLSVCVLWLTGGFCWAQEADVYAIDWQWMGTGAGATDAAYFVAASTTLDVLELEVLREVLREDYHRPLIRAGVDEAEYPFELCWRHFIVSFVDFFIYCVTCKWQSMTMADMTKYHEKRKDGLHLRTLGHMRKLADLTNQFLDELGM
jgi:hypothetical protein